MKLSVERDVAKETDTRGNLDSFSFCGKVTEAIFLLTRNPFILL